MCVLNLKTLACLLFFRLQERRRSSVVVSLPGLDVSPGDLFVSNGVADILNGTNCCGKQHILLLLCDTHCLLLSLAEVRI